MIMNENTPKIFVESLADYNAGNMIGEWIDLSRIGTEQDLKERIDEILAESDEEFAEEWFIADHENCGKIDQYEDLETLIKIADAYKELKDNWDAFVEYMEYHNINDIDTDSFQDHYRGQYESKEDFAYELAEDYGYIDKMPVEIRNYFDYEAFARDLFMGDYYMTESGYVFSY